MIKNNKDVAKHAAEIFHRLTEVGDIDIDVARASLGALMVINKCYQIDVEKKKLGIELLPSEEERTGIDGKGMVRKIS